MPANVGEMFYTGAMPWHGLGVALQRPADLEEALKVGGLNWRVDEVDLLTADEPPSPVERRKAIVRSDRPPGDNRRVLGVAHLGFKPIQNRDAALLFDSIFGLGKRVYHTGGYLGHGEVVWLLAKIDRPLRVAGDDLVEPYGLMANSHEYFVPRDAAAHRTGVSSCSPRTDYRARGRSSAVLRVDNP